MLAVSVRSARSTTGAGARPLRLPFGVAPGVH